VLPGIALALLLGFPGILGATVGALVMIGGISLITRRTRLSSDTAIGLLFVGMLALRCGDRLTVKLPSAVTWCEVLFGRFGHHPQRLANPGSSRRSSYWSQWSSVPGHSSCCASALNRLRWRFHASLYHNIMLALVALTVITSFQT